MFVIPIYKQKHQSNHYLLRNATFLGRVSLEGPWTMVSLGGFPGLVHHSDTKIKHRIYGEVYRINQDELDALDLLEGNGTFYTRTQIVTPWKKAWCYFAPPSFLLKPDRYPVVESGVWNPIEEPYS